MNINGIYVDQVALAWSLADSVRTRTDASEARLQQRKGTSPRGARTGRIPLQPLPRIHR
jgi:hypothetical protein